MVRRFKLPKEKKRKKLSAKPIHESSNAYPMMRKLIEAHHQHLVKAGTKIALAWDMADKPNTDGYIRSGSVKKASDLDRQWHDHDFVICLNKLIWDSAKTLEQQEAIMNHHLFCCAVSIDKNGEPREDEAGKVVYRLRQPPIREFPEVVAIHGMYTSQLEAFVTKAVAAKKTNRPLLDQLDAGAANGNGKHTENEKLVALANGKNSDGTPKAAKQNKPRKKAKAK